MPSTPRNFRSDINGLRAIAVLLVLLFHFGISGFGAGFLGVDVFFVISGFLMTGIIATGLEKGNFSVLRFYWARLVRLYPALLALVAGTLLFGFLLIEPVQLQTIARDSVAALLFVSNIVFWREAGYFGAPPDTMWLLHTWSLSVEWQFYLIYPIVLVLAFKVLRGPRARFGLLAAGFVLSLALSAVLGIDFANGRLASAGFYMLPPRAWEMLAGGLVVLWPWQGSAWARRAARGLEIAGIAAIIAGLFLFSDETPWPSFAALVPVLGTMLVLAANAPRSVLAFEPIQRIGTWSYSVYLWHWPLVAALAYFGLAGAPVAALGLALSLLAGWASYAFVEQPSRAWLSRRPASPPRARLRLAGGMGGAILVVFGACASVMAAHGFPQRSPEKGDVYRASLAAKADFRFPYGECGGTTMFGTALQPCELGRKSAEDDVLVIGDSFAEMWYARVAGIESKLADHAVTFLTKGGCPPVAGLERTVLGFRCAHFHGMAMEEARSERYRTVIFAGMWPSYFTREKANSKMCDANGRCVSTGTEAGLAAAVNGLSRDVDDLRLLGKTVVVLTTAPYPGFNVPVELRRRAFAGVAPDAGWTFDFSKVAARSQPIDGQLDTLRAHGAEVVDLAPLLCRNSICPVTRDGVSLYTDASHLRSAYTASVGEFLDAFLEDESAPRLAANELRGTLVP